MAEIDAEELRKEILEKIKTYYHAVFEQKKPFRRGDKIHYAGRVFDAGEMTAAADSVLDFWLTEGRYESNRNCTSYRSSCYNNTKAFKAA